MKKILDNRISKLLLVLVLLNSGIFMFCHDFLPKDYDGTYYACNGEAEDINKIVIIKNGVAFVYEDGKIVDDVPIIDFNELIIKGIAKFKKTTPLLIKKQIKENPKIIPEFQNMADEMIIPLFFEKATLDKKDDIIFFIDPKTKEKCSVKCRLTDLEKIKEKYK